MFGLKKTHPYRKKVEVRFESIGGQGGHSAGKILAEAAVIECGYSGHHFSTYGSEKRGTPVQSHVRFFTDLQPVRSASPVQSPDALVICHESLLKYQPQCISDMQPKTSFLINSNHHPLFMKLPKGAQFHQLATVPALEIAFQTQSRVNVVMLGALAKLIPEISKKNIRQVIQRFFAHLPPEILKKNLRAFDLGYRKVKITEFRQRKAKEHLQTKSLLPPLGWNNAPVGGVISNPGNSVLKDLSASRVGTIPVFDPEECINCGYCDMICPDYCFVWGSDQNLKQPLLMGIDYQYCKGCQKCIEICPVNALTLGRDRPEFTSTKRLKSVTQRGTQL